MQHNDNKPVPQDLEDLEIGCTHGSGGRKSSSGVQGQSPSRGLVYIHNMRLTNTFFKQCIEQSLNNLLIDPAAIIMDP